MNKYLSRNGYYETSRSFDFAGADYQKRMAQLQDRLLRNAQVQEGEAPAENLASLLRELEKVADDLTRLIQRINATNVASELEADMTLSDALGLCAMC